MTQEEELKRRKCLGRKRAGGKNDVIIPSGKRYKNE